MVDREEEYATRIAFLKKAMASEACRLDEQFARLLARTEDVVTHVHRHGYAIIEGLVDLAQVERLRAGLEPLFAATIDRFNSLDPARPRQAVHIHNALAKTRAADEAAVNPFLRMVIGSILGFDFTFHAGAVVMAHNPGSCAQPLHRDDASYAALPRPRMPLVITASIALDDFTVENGATRIVPGSCWWERSRRASEEEVVQFAMPAGSVLLWDGAILHGGGANVTSSRMRRTLTLNYVRGWLRTQFNQFLSMPRDLVLSLPAELQKDLGYRPSAKGLGECDGEDPLSYLQRMMARGGDGVQPALGPEASGAHRA